MKSVSAMAVGAALVVFLATDVAQAAIGSSHAATGSVVVQASATVNAAITLSKSGDLDCGTVTYNNTSCDSGSGYHPAGLLITTNSASGWTITLSSKDFISSQTRSPYTLSLHGTSGTNWHTFTMLVTASPESSSTATSGTTVAVSGGSFSGLDANIPPDVYTAVFVATAATNE